MPVIRYRDCNGNVYTFEEVLEFFDRVVEQFGSATLVYAPKDKLITFLRPYELPYVFNELD